jgi:hypothetical protein
MISPFPLHCLADEALWTETGHLSAAQLDDVSLSEREERTKRKKERRNSIFNKSTKLPDSTMLERERATPGHPWSLSTAVIATLPQTA